jgi:hypothetical protein
MHLYRRVDSDKGARTGTEGMQYGGGWNTKNHQKKIGKCKVERTYTTSPAVALPPRLTLAGTERR